MRLFVILTDPENRGIGDDVLRAYDAMPRSRGLNTSWRLFDTAAVLTAWDDSYGDPMIATDGDYVAAGMVRLDNRRTVAHWAECDTANLTDLDLILRIVAKYGTRKIEEILGDYAFVVWNGRTRRAIAACDAFAVRKLYYAQHHGVTAFASRAEAVALQTSFDVTYLVELLARHAAPRDTTVYVGVRPLPAASMAVLEGGAVTIREYWSATDLPVQQAWANAEQDAIETCRQLLIESVRLRVGRQGQTWAQLSGGLDSSSIVCLVQWLAEQGTLDHGLGGSITAVDRPGAPADERAYSDAVLQRWPMHNEAIVDAPTWYEDEFPPPVTDQPRLDFVCHPRDRRMCAAVRRAGGRVLLTGWGGDELFMGSMLFFADWCAQGRVGLALREMARRAAIGRVSFWQLAYRNALLPLIPWPIRRRLVHNRDDAPVQPWLTRAAMRRSGIEWRSPSMPEYGGRFGHKYRHAVAVKMSTLPLVTDHGVVADTVDVRHPMLYRPLVEFAAQLPPELRARPHAQRWVLREAMRGILPDAVRTRVGKPDTGELLARSVITQRTMLAPLVKDPILADLGVLDGAKLRDAFNAASHETAMGTCMHLPLVATLAVEAWLQNRAGRWPRGGHRRSTEVQAWAYRPHLRAT